MTIYTQTLGGIMFPLTHPKKELVSVTAMASQLARIPRFNGATELGVYSVAQHSVVGAEAILEEEKNEELAQYFLLHDAHEYLIGDITNPVVKVLDLTSNVVPALNALKSNLDRVIHAKFGITWPPRELIARKVYDWDKRMCCEEARQRLTPPIIPWGEKLPPIKGDFRPWHEATARAAFTGMLHELFGREY